MSNGIFAKFKVASNKQLIDLKPNDIVVFDVDDIQANYTLLTSPTETALHSIHRILQVCPSYIQGQYVYPDTDIHLTVLGNIDVSIDSNVIMEAVKVVMRDITFSFRMFGVASNMHAASITCYPQGFDMYLLRQQIRIAIGVKSDDYALHIPEYEHMGWLSFMRYLRKPTSSELDEFKLFMNEEFGFFIPMRLQLYKNRSKTLRKSGRELVAEICFR